MLEQLRDIIRAANNDYHIVYEDKNMMNVKADDIQLEDGFAFINEFAYGRLDLTGYVPVRTMNVEIFFSRFAPMQCDAIVREGIRNRIIDEIVYPFIEKYNVSAFTNLTEWGIDFPPVQWDANEVSVLLSFEAKLIKC